MKVLRVLALVAVAIAASGFAPLDDTRQAKAQITKMLNDYRDATARRDAAKVEKVIRTYFTPEAVWIDQHGQQYNVDERILQLKRAFGNTKSVSSCKVNLDKISVQGATASTTESTTLTGTTVNPLDAKKISKLDFRATWRGSYVKKGAKWLCTQNKYLLQIVKIDGKRFPPSPPPQKAKAAGGG